MRSGWSPSALTVGGVIVGFALLSGGLHSRTAAALQVGPVSPVSQGIDHNWTEVNAPNEVSAINQTSCSGGDGNWIVGGNPYKSSFQLQLGSLPPGALVTSVDLTLCYGDDNATVDGFEHIIPFVRMGNSEYDGTALASPGMSPVTNTQAFSVPSSGVLEVGVKDTGYLAQSRLRVYAIWAVVHYSPPPTVSVVVSLAGGTQPYELGELFEWVIDVTVSPPGTSSLALTGEFDPSVLTNFNTTTTQGTCTVGFGNFGCGFSTSVQVRVHLGARVSPACETLLQVHVSSLGTVSGANVAQAQTPVAVNAGCVPPTATPTATATPTPTTATASPVSSPSPSISPQTPTASVGAPSPTSSTRTTVPNPTIATPTVTPNPTATPGSGAVMKFHLRAMFLARD